MKKDNTNLIDRIIYIFFFVALLLLAIGFYFLFFDIEQSVFAEARKENNINDIVFDDSNSVELTFDVVRSRSVSDFSEFYSNFNVTDYNNNYYSFGSWANLPITNPSSAISYFETLFNTTISVGTYYYFNISDYGDFFIHHVNNSYLFYFKQIYFYRSTQGVYDYFDIVFVFRDIVNSAVTSSTRVMHFYALSPDNALSNYDNFIYCDNLVGLSDNLITCELTSNTPNSLFIFRPLILSDTITFDTDNYIVDFDYYKSIFKMSGSSSDLSCIIDSISIYLGNYTYPLNLNDFRSLSRSSTVLQLYYNDGFTVNVNHITIYLSDFIDYDIYHSLVFVFNFSSSYIWQYDNANIGNISLSGSSLPYYIESGFTAPRITLSAPVVTIQNNILSWNTVEYAEYYIIKRVSDGVTYYVDNYTYNSYVVSVNGDYSVQACNSDTTSYIDSVYSNVISVTDFHDTQYSFLLLMSSIMDSILYLFKSFLNYNVLGVNMFGAFGAFLFICLILFFIRKFRGD